MNKYLFDKENTIEIINEVSIWPGKNNGYDLKINGPKLKNFTVHFVPKEEYNLAMGMRIALSQFQIDEMLPFIENYGIYQYSEGVDSEAMNNAGASL